MSVPAGRTWPPVVGSLVIWSVVMVLSVLTSFVQRSPIHSDSWWPLLTVWGVGILIGAALLAVRKRAWAAAWILGTAGGAIGYAGGVVIFLINYGT